MRKSVERTHENFLDSTKHRDKSVKVLRSYISRPNIQTINQIDALERKEVNNVENSEYPSQTIISPLESETSQLEFTLSKGKLVISSFGSYRHHNFINNWYWDSY